MSVLTLGFLQILQAKSEGREIPLVVTKCIEAVEAYGMSSTHQASSFEYCADGGRSTGMTYEGVYRKTGGMGQTKLITQHFESKQDFDLQDRDKFNDLAAVTSCMKNYFRALPNPLFTHDLHEEFVAAAGAFASFRHFLPFTALSSALTLFLWSNRAPRFG